MAETDKLPWYALYVHSRAEKKVYTQLTELGYEAYLPLITTMKKWSDRMKKVEEPLFKSYVFVFSNEKEHLPIVSVYGVVKFVSFERKSVIVPENQILAIKHFIQDYEMGDEGKILDNDDLREGQMVRIISGPMKGLCGKLESVKDKRRLIVYIDVVGQFIPVNIPRTKVEPIREGMLQ